MVLNYFQVFINLNYTHIVNTYYFTMNNLKKIDTIFVISIIESNSYLTPLPMYTFFKISFVKIFKYLP